MTKLGLVSLARAVVRIAFWIEVGLGATFWSGHADNLVPLHVIVGLVLILGLEALAIMARRAAVRSWLVLFSLCWGILMPALGLLQGHLLTADAHWLIQVAHLLAGVTAVALAEVLAARIRSTWR